MFLDQIFQALHVRLRGFVGTTSKSLRSLLHWALIGNPWADGNIFIWPEAGLCRVFKNPYNFLEKVNHIDFTL